MDKNKLIVFLLFAFLPMVAVGLILHFSLFTVEMETPERSAILTRTIFSAGAMLIPLLAVVFTQLIFREPMFRNLGISFKINRWWFVGWLLMPVVALAVLGVTLLMPGACWSPDGEAMQAALSAFPESFGVWGVIVVTLLSGMLAGLTLNALVAFGKTTLFIEFYDTLVAPVDLSALERVRQSYKDLKDKTIKPAWYDSLKLPPSTYKIGRGARMSQLSTEMATAYLDLFATAREVDRSAKTARNRAYVEGLISNGGPAINTVRDMLGAEPAETMFRRFLFGTE